MQVNKSPVSGAVPWTRNLEEQRLSLLVTVNTHHLLPACLQRLLLLIVCVLTQFPIATGWTKREFFRWQIIMKDISFLFSASTSVDHCGRCYLFCSRAHRVARRWKMPGVEGEGPGRAGCCTCLLPWGFWRSDYAVMRLREWRICFRKGGSGKKEKKKWSVHELEPQPPITWQGHLF